MNFLGMGPLEVLIILLIAFIFLGPQKMVEAGRTMGKLAAQLRRMTAELPKMIEEETSLKPSGDRRVSGKNDSVSSSTAPSTDGTTTADDESDPSSENPVPFGRPGGVTTEGDGSGQSGSSPEGSPKTEGR